MRLLTPASALISAAVIASAATGLAVSRRTEDPPARAIDTLTAAEPTTGPRAADPTSPADQAPSPTPTASDPPPAVGAEDDEAAAQAAAPVPASPSPAVHVPGAEEDGLAVLKDDGAYVIDPDAGVARHLSDGPIYDVEWLSETRIAYVRGAKLWVGDIDGSDHHEIHSGVVDGGLREIALSPDRRWLAFVSGSGSDRPVWIMRPDGSGARKIWNETLNGTMAWSTDSKQLAFVAGGSEVGLRVYDAATDTSRMVYGAFVMSPHWTAVPNEIVFSEGSSIMAVDVVTEQYRQVVHTDGLLFEVKVDPSGRRVYFPDARWRYADIATGVTGTVEQDMMSFDWTDRADRVAMVQRTGEQDFDGRWVTQLSVARGDFSGGRAIATAGTYTTLIAPYWSPSGKRLILTTSLNKTPHPKP